MEGFGLAFRQWKLFSSPQFGLIRWRGPNHPFERPERNRWSPCLAVDREQMVEITRGEALKMLIDKYREWGSDITRRQAEWKLFGGAF